MKLKLELEKLRDLLSNLYKLINVRFVIFDEDFNKIIGYPEESCDFCTLVKSHPELREKCRKTDKAGCKNCRESNALHIYPCHAGLMEIVAPIKMNDITLGYIMFGQILEKGKDKTEILNYISTYTNDISDFEKSLNKICSKSRDQIEAAAKIVEVCTCYLWIAELIKIDEGNLIYHLSNYINNNIKEDLSVERLCDIFDISRSKLYDISHKYYGMSIAKYIRRKRVENAAEYLKNSDCKVSEAADAAGFFDYNYFSKIFKAEMGISPGKFKALHNNFNIELQKNKNF